MTTPAAHVHVDLHLTHHAKRRFKERVGLPQRACRKAALDALSGGLAPDDLPGPHRDRLVSMMLRHDHSGQSYARVHQGVAFVFTPQPIKGGVTLVTVLPDFDLPPGA